MLTFMMTLPLTLGVTAAVIGAAAARDCFSAKGQAPVNPTA